MSMLSRLKTHETSRLAAKFQYLELQIFASTQLNSNKLGTIVENPLKQ